MQRPCRITFVFISLFLVSSYGEKTGNKVTNYNIGAIIDVDSRIGKEEKAALEFAVQSFNNDVSNNHKLSLYIQNSRRNPLLAATAAKKLIEEQEVIAIIGLETSEEAALVADIGSRARVPVLSFAAPALITPSRWPFLFRRTFRDENPEEDNFQPSVNALRAYDSIRIIKQAMDSDENSPDLLLKNILSSNFTGLSGEIHFQQRKLSHDPILRIVNVIGKSYNELDFWLPGTGFSKNNGYVGYISADFTGTVIWPDGSKRVPKGWVMPTNKKPMIIGVPARTAFEKFVKVEDGKHPGQKNYDGFCIELFYKVVNVLEYVLIYQFDPHNGTYDELVHKVYNKTYDAAVGDITILANRTTFVEFTQPYAATGLSMIVPVKPESSAWMFLKPFTTKMWLVTGSILIYTMFIVWFLEHQSNPDFRGPWNNQIGTVFWFTFSSIFFAHREKIYSNLTKVVVVVWLFVALILTSSYTASLTSMLTVQRLEPTVTDIEWLKRSNVKIGCDGDSFVRTYLEDVLKFKSYNIENVSSEYKYEGEFKSNHIAAAFLELPYGRVFLNHYCKKFTTTAPTYTFGGLGFIFQKGSPVARDFSRAILKLSEDGTLMSLEQKWFAPSPECSANVTEESKTDSLSIHSFWGLFIISVATSTVCLLLFLAYSLKRYWNHEEENNAGILPLVDENVWNKAMRLAKYIYNGKVCVRGEVSAAPRVPDIYKWSSPTWDYDRSSSHISMENYEVKSQAESEIGIQLQAHN
ncbi:glutamate receptor 2.5-like isoform X3 [Gossypium arboreum]|uniref:glutamate receptor 2.5-like isoform X3 n=1 Tax=Gossypium arboreum TaxID=29729 RepID=UPI0022F1D1D8|nr:glutamate receptor 2.5-like isoform X3 [Gossypium arboreum]